MSAMLTMLATYAVFLFDGGCAVAVLFILVCGVADLPRHSLSTGASREAPVDKRAHQDCNKTRAVSTDTNRNCMKTLFGVHAQVS